jgi:hypothetical protein
MGLLVRLDEVFNMRGPSRLPFSYLQWWG